MNSARAFKIAVGILFPAFIVAAITIAIAFRDTWFSVFFSRENVQAWISSFGVTAPLVYIAVQVFQVVVFVVPGEVIQIAGGYLFGVVGGTLYSIVGIAVGSAIDFWMARSLGRAFVEGVFGERHVSGFDAFTRRKGPQTAFFLLFVIPGIPKDVLVYVAGISRLRFMSFLGITMAGRLPGILGSALIGDSAADGRWTLAIVIFSVSVVLFLLGLVYRKPLVSWVQRFTGRSTENARTEPEDLTPDD